MNYVNHKYTAVAIAITIITSLWFAHLFGLFSVLNGYSYDLMMRSFPEKTASEKIIVIEVDSSYAEKGDEIWLKLLKALLSSDAEGVAFAFLPENVTPKFYQLAAESHKTTFGAHLVETVGELNQESLFLPNASLATDIEYGLISKPLSQHGVFRTQHSVTATNGVNFPSFEKRAAQMQSDDLDVLSNDDFRVNFIGNQYRIPKIQIERILNDGLIDELVAGRTVLIGVNRHQSLLQYFTPVSTDQHMTSEVMFHAFALDTLLSARQISDLPVWMFLLLIVCVTTASLFLGQWLGFRVSMYASMIASLASVVAVWGVLHHLSIWIPIAELVLAQWLSLLLVWGFRVYQEQKSLEQMLFGFPLQAREKGIPVSIYTSDEPWKLLVSIINQSLNLNRLIFLERIPGDHRLKEIIAMNCSISDIHEKRRDYERVPYSTAIRENRPILLDTTYLKEVSVEEQQYMAPLIFAGEVLGFWVYTVEPGKIKSQSKFNALTHSFMVQVSETLHYRHEWRRRVGSEQNKLWHFMRVGGNEKIQQLNQSTSLMDKRVFELHGVFNSINISCVLYDLFGRTLMANKDMDQLAQQAGFRIYSLSMLEFIIDITDFDESGARNTIQRVIFDHTAVSIPVTHKAIKRSFMLHILPLHYDENSQYQKIPDESQVFQISGVLCELVDVTELKKLYQLKEQMFERFYFQIRNDIGSILTSLPFYDNQPQRVTRESVALKNISGKANQMLDMLEQVHTQMNVDIEYMLTNDLLCYPVDANVALQAAIVNLQEAIDQREIKFNLYIPDLLSLVFASPVELEIVLHAVLLTMVEDTYETDVIWVKFEEKDHLLTCHINNSGIGISDNKLQQLNDSNNNDDKDLLNFNYAIHCVNRWGGSLNISSEMGVGSKAELVLRCFL